MDKPSQADHSGQNIAEAIVDVLGIGVSKLVAKTDNGSNFVAVFNSLDWICVSCFGHNLSLAINKVLILDHVRRAVKKCCSVVEFFGETSEKASATANRGCSHKMGINIQLGFTNC